MSQLRQQECTVRWTASENAERTDVVELVWTAMTDGNITYRDKTFKPVLDHFLSTYHLECLNVFGLSTNNATRTIRASFTLANPDNCDTNHPSTEGN
jgi:hypothetical protein